MTSTWITSAEGFVSKTSIASSIATGGGGLNTTVKKFPILELYRKYIAFKMCYPWTRKKNKFVTLKEKKNQEFIKNLRLNDECAVCLAVILVSEAIICYSCNKIMHKKCLKRWENTCNKQQVPFSCPLCRAELETLKND